MLNKIACTAAGMAFAMFVAAPAFAADDTSPMPQTRGMQGMDPALHDQPARDPYEGCTPNAQKAAQQAKHPMPETRGMKGMDPKAHTMDCPEAPAAKADNARHVHRAPGN